jgi:putative membrane protein
VEVKTLMSDRPDLSVTVAPAEALDDNVPVVSIADPDSRARTHLANERTFLAWLRTGLALIALGLASAQFLEAELLAGMIAILLVVAGIVLVVTGQRRFLHSQQLIEQHQALTDNRPIKMATLLIVAVGLVAIGVVMIIEL